MRGAGVIAGGAVLALAVVVWWGLRGQEVSGGVVLAAWLPRPYQDAASSAAPASAALFTAQGWVQTEADKSWCRLEDSAEPPQMSASEATSPKEWRRAWAATSPVRKLQQDEEDRVTAGWVKRLHARGDERSLAGADLLEDKEAATRHLLDLARNSQDPVIYAWAMRTCAREADCELSALRWAQLDPGNAAPWVWEAERAWRSGDTQAQREALYQIGLSSRNQNYDRPLLQLLLNGAEARASGLQMAVETELVARLGFSAMPNLRGAYDYCNKAGAETDTLRHGVCLDAAEALWRQADDMMSARMATNIAKRHAPAGDPVWPSRRKETDVLLALGSKQYMRELEEAGGSKDACAGVAVMHGQVQIFSTLGELAYLRKLRDTSVP